MSAGGGAPGGGHALPAGSDQANAEGETLWALLLARFRFAGAGGFGEEVATMPRLRLRCVHLQILPRIVARRVISRTIAE
jgi:hypothetical protein